VIDDFDKKGKVVLSERIQTTTLDDAPAYWFLNAVHILLARSESEGGSYSLVHLTVPPGFSTPYHVHHTEDEALYVLEGELTVICNGNKMVREAGSYIFLPRGVPHGFRYTGGENSRVLIHVIPGGKVGFIGMMLEMAIPIRRGVLPAPTPPDFLKLDALCKKNEIEILGSLPA
jgi:quercetin dioxygenase-like cupin family protein